MMNTTGRSLSLSLCHLCGGRLELLLDYPVAGQVTSDCRPWQGRSLLAACQSCGVLQKPLTSEWQEEVEEIYAAYAVYAQAEGGEQRSFDAGSGANRSRSQTIVNWLRSKADLPEKGTLLDIGCGNGSFLQSFREAYPNWQMIGTELDDRNRSIVESIPGVIKLHTGPLDQLLECFDLIVMIHALEHIPGPINFLAGLGKLLKSSGSLLLEVPDLETSPFDILIADHCTHFSKQALRWAVELAGYNPTYLVDNCVAKELTLLANNFKSVSIDMNQFKQDQPFDDFRYAKNHLHWLHLLLIQAMAIEGPVGIFGTSISATWLAAALQGRVSFFVDEDPNRIGQIHLQIPIIAIEQAPVKIPVLMPIRRDIALAIIARLGSIHRNMIVPPVNRD
jgi:SAM-dependent methyltransferase